MMKCNVDIKAGIKTNLQKKYSNGTYENLNYAEKKILLSCFSNRWHIRDGFKKQKSRTGQIGQIMNT
jgi:hypothetical protein